MTAWQAPAWEAINIGTGKGTSVLEVIQAFETETGKTLNWAFGPRRAGDVIEIFANADKAKTLRQKGDAKITLTSMDYAAFTNLEAQVYLHLEGE
mgnify:CR=1 FL=1